MAPTTAGRNSLQSSTSHLRNLVRKRDFYAGGLMILLGLGVALKGTTYRAGTLMHMGPGFLPTALGVILVLVGIAIAAVALLIGPVTGLVLRLSRRNIAATISIGLTSAVFLVAAHIAFARFAPMLSSRQLAATLLEKGNPADDFIIYGDQSDASSVVFYTHRFFAHPAFVVMPRCSQHGIGSSLIWGSCYPDAPNIFLSEDQLAAEWGHGERHWVFAQDTNRSKVEQLLAGRLIPVQTIADKTLWTDRPL